METVPEANLNLKVLKSFEYTVFNHLMEFLNDNLQDELKFPSCLSKIERAYVRDRACAYGLNCKSVLVGSRKYIVVFKKKWSSILRKDLQISLNSNIHTAISNLLKKYPVTKKDRDIMEHAGPASKYKCDSLNGCPKVPITKVNSNLMDFKRRLPVYNHLQAIGEVISCNQVSLIMGDPGSGKTSQIPQFMLDVLKKINKACYIVCAQPSRLAAMSISQRVALERNEEVGNTIGYESKLERDGNDKTILTYCSTEVLLKKLMNGKNCLCNVTHIFIDEVHERNKLTDVLLIALKLIVKDYPFLHLVLMSAQIDTQEFTRFFPGLAVYQIDHPRPNIQVLVLENIHNTLKEKNPNRDVCEEVIIKDRLINYSFVLDVIKLIHLSMAKGSILVFVPTLEDTFNLASAISTCTDLEPSTYKIFTLHEDLQVIDHKNLYMETNDIRKIILSTEFAESSITIYDVVYVVDLGLKRSRFHNSITDSDTKLVLISKSQMSRRALRAGRTKNGKYFILQKQGCLDVAMKKSVSELSQAPITDICLIIKQLAPELTIIEFLGKAIEPPPLVTIQQSVAALISIGAFDSNENVTHLGNILLNFSVDPRLGKMIFYACIFKCLDPILTIVCCLSCRNIFKPNADVKSTTNLNNFVKSLASKSYSDHMALLRAFQSWSKHKLDQTSTYSSLISEADMESVTNLRIKLVAELRAIELIRPRAPGDMRDLNCNSEKWHVIKSVLFFALYPNVANVDLQENWFLHSSNERRLYIHPNSTLHLGNDIATSLAALPTRWIMFGGLREIQNEYHIEFNTVVTPLTVALFGGPLKVSHSLVHVSIDSDSESENDDDSRAVNKASLVIDDWITAYFDNHEKAFDILNLRKKFASLVMRKMRYPSLALNVVEESIVETIIYVLGEEESQYNIICPPKIGQRPHKSLTVPCRMTCEFSMTHSKEKQTPLCSLTNKRSPTPTSPTVSKYFLVKLENLGSVQSLQSAASWTVKLSSEFELIRTLVKNKMRVIFIFCVEENCLTFYGCGEFSSFQSDHVHKIHIKWIAINRVEYDDSLKLQCENYQIKWDKDINELTFQTGQQIERLLSNPIMKPNTSRPIYKNF